jgi:hypothetical protein
MGAQEVKNCICTLNFITSYSPGLYSKNFNRVAITLTEVRRGFTQSHRINSGTVP